MRRLTRRRFLHETAGLAASAVAAPLLAADKPKAPSERLNLAVVGVSGRGADNLAGVGGENIVALCDVDADRAGDARKQFPKADFTQDFRQVVERGDVDAVVVSTPDHTHAVIAVAAMKAGKHVYCEKPLAHSVHEIRTMMQIAAEKKLVTQMGTQIHANDNYRRVVEIVQAGTLGPVDRVQVWCAKRPEPRRLAKKPAVPSSLDFDLWLGPAPQQDYNPAFVPFHWRWFWDFGGGILADMACHFMDLAHWALDLHAPSTVAATGGKKLSEGDQNVPDVLQVDYTYPTRGDQPKVHLTWYSGVTGPALDAKEAFRGFPDGVLFEGPKGKLVANYDKYLLLPEETFKDFTPPKPTIAKSIGHHKEWIEAIKGNGKTLCNFAYSGALAETVLLGNVAYRCGKTLEWNDAAGTTDAAGAAAYSQREYRKGWSL
jgi:predicted dehydrogenase